MKKRPTIIVLLAFMVICLITSCTSQSANAPVIKSIEYLDKDNKPLAVTDGWVSLEAESIIKVAYKGPATHIDFYSVPTGTEVLFEQRIIGRVDVDKNDTIAEFKWEVPYGFMGSVWVLVYNGDIARTSDTDQFYIRAIYEK